MKKLNNLFFLILASLAFSCLAEETAPIELKDASVTPDHLTEKAENDAVEVGVVEFVVETEEAEPPVAEAVESGEEAEEEEESDVLSSKYLAGPAEIIGSLSLPLAFTGVGAAAGLLPAMENYAGLAATPFTTIAGAGLGAVAGTVFCPCLLLRGIFDTFTAGAFVDGDYDVTDSADKVEDKVIFVNDILTFNDPFDESEDDEPAAEDEDEAEEEPTPEEETEE